MVTLCNSKSSVLLGLCFGLAGQNSQLDNKQTFDLGATDVAERFEREGVSSFLRLQPFGGCDLKALALSRNSCMLSLLTMGFTH